MKFNCRKKRLYDAVTLGSRVSTKKSTLDSLKSLILDVVDTKLTIYATNLEVAIKIELPIKSGEDGKIAVDAHLFNSILGTMDDKEELICKLEGNTLIISSERGDVSMETLSTEDFPLIPEVDMNVDKVQLPAVVLKEGLQSTVFACAQSTIRPELSSVYIYNKDNNLYFVATDSFRLSEYIVNVKNISDIKPILIPSTVAQNLIQIFQDIEDDVDMYIEEEQVSFVSSDIVVTSRIIDSSFPDYEKIIPTESTVEMSMFKKDLSIALKQVQLFSDNFNQIEVGVGNDDSLHIKSTKKGSGEVKHSVPGKVINKEKQDLLLKFNYQYFNDFLSHLKSDSFGCYFSGPSKPIILKDDSSKVKFSYLIMPMSK
jgi:DNA polymerase-3 subunit beta